MTLPAFSASADGMTALLSSRVEPLTHLKAPLSKGSMTEHADPAMSPTARTRSFPEHERESAALHPAFVSFKSQEVMPLWAPSPCTNWPPVPKAIVGKYPSAIAAAASPVAATAACA